MVTIYDLLRRFARYRQMRHISRLYRHRAHFQKQVKHDLKAIAYLDKEIAIAESEFRKFR